MKPFKYEIKYRFPIFLVHVQSLVFHPDFIGEHGNFKKLDESFVSCQSANKLDVRVAKLVVLS